MVRETGVDGVVVGRGCQGRPWLFGDLQAAFEGSDQRHRPDLRQVAEGVYRHAELMVETFGDEGKALREIRKHMAWYFKGYVVGSELRTKLALVTSLEVLRGTLDQLDLDSPYPGVDAEGPRGRAGSPKKPALPKDWLLNRHAGRRTDPRHLRRGTGCLRWLRPGPPHPSWTGYDRPRLRPLGGGAAQEHLPLGLRARPRPGPALLGAAPARREDPGGGPGYRRLRPDPAHAQPRSCPGGPRTGPRAGLRPRRRGHRLPQP